jgi:hypothetical protein
MKLHQGTLGLLAIGLVSASPVARADEKPSAVQTALAGTTLSGYVSTSANVGLTPNYANSLASQIPYQPVSKENGFNLDVVNLTIAKPEDESPWASGYEVELLFGPDAVDYNPSANATSSTDYSIKQAYVTLHTPLGNGLDWKIGVFDALIGYENFNADIDSNYTRSWGFWLEPAVQTGVLATYPVSDAVSLSAGVANTAQSGINDRNDYSVTSSVWQKAFMGSLSLTAPAAWGWAAGSTLSGGAIYGFADNGYFGSINAGHNTHNDGNQANYYVGATVNTPWKALTTGLAFDYVENLFGGSATDYANAWALGAYANYQATDKLSFHARSEYVEGTFHGLPGGYNDNNVEVTGTVEYDLWANVISRLEVRWDHFLSLDQSGGHYLAEAVPALPEATAVGLYANLIFKF